MIHEAQGRQPTQQPVTSIIVLDKKVVIAYDSGLSADEKATISKAVASAAELLNKNADKLTPDEKKAIGEISSFSAAKSPKDYLGATGKGSMTLSIDYVGKVSPAWIASLFGHEGQHYLNFGKYSGENRWRDEQSASKTQLGIGGKIGFTPAETNHLREWMDDKNRADMQKHMERGYYD